MVMQIGCKENERFLLYPRFLAMVFDRKLPELVKTGAPIRITVMNRRIFADCKPKKENREETPLFGHVTDPDYVAPENDAWMHPEEEEEDDDAPPSPPHQPQPPSPPPQSQPPQPQPQPQSLLPPQQPSPPQPPPNQPSPHQTPPSQPPTSPAVIGAESSSSDYDDDNDDVLDDSPVVGKNVVRKRAGGVFVNVEKRRRLAEDDRDADYVPPETETRRVSSSTSIPVPVATFSVPPPVSEFADFPGTEEATFVEKFDDINLDLGPSSSQVNDLESQVASLKAKVASLTDEVDRLKKENNVGRYAYQIRITI